MVSVIVPVYNAQATIERTLASILRQTLKPDEIIVVDDRSTDDSLRIIQSVIARFPGQIFKVLENTANMGVGATRNHGLSLATGQFVMMVDADDLIQRDSLKRLVAEAESDAECDVFIGAVVNIDNNDLVSRMSDAHVRLHRARFVFDGEYLAADNLLRCGSGALIRRKSLAPEDLFLTDRDGCEDWLFFLSLARTCKFKKIPGIVVGYRRPSGSSPRSAHSILMLRGYLRARKCIRQWYPSVRYLDLERGRWKLYEFLLGNLVKTKQYKAAIGVILHGIMVSPIAIPAFASLSAYRMVKLKLSGSCRARERMSCDQAPITFERLDYLDVVR